MHLDKVGPGCDAVMAAKPKTETGQTPGFESGQLAQLGILPISADQPA